MKKNIFGLKPVQLFDESENVTITWKALQPHALVSYIYLFTIYVHPHSLCVDVDSKQIYIHVYETSGCAYNLKVDVDDNWAGIMIKRTSNQWKLPNSLAKSAIDIPLNKTKLCVITLFYTTFSALY